MSKGERWVLGGATAALVAAACHSGGDSGHGTAGRGGDGSSAAGASGASAAGVGSGAAATSGGSSAGAAGRSGGGSGAGKAGEGGSAPLGSAGDGGRPDEQPPLPTELTWEHEFGSPLGRIWGSGPDDIYAIGMGTIVHSMGDGEWVEQSPKTSARLTGIWGSGRDDIYISAYSNLVLHSTGDGEWEHQGLTSGLTANAVWGTAADNVYVSVGNGIMHSAGDGGWVLEQSPSGAFVGQALWGSTATDIYLATSFANLPSIYHSTGGGVWRGQNGSPRVTLDDISGAGATQIYAAGGDAVYGSKGDGVWTAELRFDADFAEVVWALDSEHVYACTQNDGWFYRSNGAGEWSSGTRIDASVEVACSGIWGTSPTNLYVSTSNGIYHGTVN